MFDAARRRLEAKLRFSAEVPEYTFGLCPAATFSKYDTPATTLASIAAGLRRRNAPIALVICATVTPRTAISAARFFAADVSAITSAITHCRPKSNDWIASASAPEGGSAAVFLRFAHLRLDGWISFVISTKFPGQSGHSRG